VDADGVYWTQKGGALMVGSLDGAEKPRRVAELASNGGAGEKLGSDSSHLYVLEKTHLVRWAKTDWTEQRLELPHDYTGGALAVGDYVYLALWGCASITRVDKATLALETIYIDIGPVNPERSVGGTALVLDGAALYCGAWYHVFVVDRWPDATRRSSDAGADVGAVQCCEGTDCYGCGTARRILNAASRIEGLAVVGDDVYWMDRPHSGWVTCADPDGAGPMGLIDCSSSIGKVSKRGGTATVYRDNWGSAGSLFYASSVDKLFFLNGGPSSFELKTHDYALVLPATHRGSVAIDDRYAYWTWWGGENVGGRIQRVPLDQEPERIRPSTPIELE
jgi:hypothetical protein